MTGRSFLALVWLLCWAGSSVAAVQVTVDRTEISINDSLNLVLRATDGENLRNTRYGLLQDYFELGTASRRTNIVTSLGKTERVEELIIPLTPRRSGKLIIPSLNVDGTVTDPIAITVKEQRKDVYARDLVFLEAEASKNSVYVNEQFILTLRYFHAIRTDNESLTGFEIPNAEYTQLSSSTYNTRLDGIAYRVIEIPFAVVPDSPGELTIPAIEIRLRQLERAASLLDMGKRMRRRSEPLAITVKPIPANYPRNHDWLPSSNLTLEQDWSADPAHISVGDSLTRTLTLRAAGVDSSMLPPLDTAAVEGIKIYPDQPSFETVSERDGTTALGIHRSAWVATEAGSYRVPPVEIAWWNTETDELSYARLPASMLSVTAPAIAAANTSPVEVPTAQTLPAETTVLTSTFTWQAIAVALALGWMLTTFYFLRRAPTTATVTSSPLPQASAQQGCDALIKACKSGDPEASRQALLALKPALSNEQLAASGLLQATLKLDQYLYGTRADAWDVAELLTAAKSLRKQIKPARKDKHSRALPALYKSR